MCPHCDLRLPLGELKLRCRDVLHFSKLAVAGAYEHPMAKATMDALKYESLRDLAEPLGQYLASAIRTQWPQIPRGAVLVPIPLHRARERERGFNQSSLIAKACAIDLRLDVHDTLLKRTRHTKKQVGLPASERKENIIGAFIADQADAKVTYILIDDVTTTGSTLREAARALRKAGAKTIWAATVAQGQDIHRQGTHPQPHLRRTLKTTMTPFEVSRFCVRVRRES